MSTQVSVCFHILKKGGVGDLRKDRGVPETQCLEGHGESLACFVQSFSKHLLSTSMHQTCAGCWDAKMKKTWSLSSKFTVPWERQEHTHGCHRE